MAKRDEKKAPPLFRQLLDAGDFRAARAEAKRVATDAAMTPELRADAESVLAATRIDPRALLAAAAVLLVIFFAAYFGLFR